MEKRKLPQSVRKYIRTEKAMIRRKFSDAKEIEEKIKELMIKFKKNLKPKT